MPEHARLRTRTLQPDCDDEVLLDGPQQINHHQVLNELRVAILCWTHGRQDLPEFFDDEFQIESVVRQVVSSVVVKTQKMKRKITQGLEAYDYGTVHSDPLPTDNLFELRPIEKPLEFPSKPTESTEQILYKEKVKACYKCDGAGETVCSRCSGTVSIACTGCDAAGEVKCQRCDGAGEVMIDAAEAAPCETCDGVGSNACRRCSGSGEMRCGDCSGGTVDCRTCNTTGKLKTVNYLKTITSTVTEHKLFCKNGWVEEDDAIALDSVLMRHHQFELASSNSLPREQLRGVLPGHLVVPAEQCAQKSSAKRTNTTIDSGVHIEVRTVYLYHVLVDHNGNKGEFFVGGCSNTVTPHKIPSQSKKLLSKFARAIAPKVTDNAHVVAVKNGEVCLADSRLLGLAIKKAGIKVRLDEDGYKLTIPNVPKGYSKIRMGFFHDANQQIVVQTSFLLGDADRECLPAALALNKKLPVGQIGLLELSGGALERFYLVDRSRYDTLSVPHYLYLARKLLSVAHNIKTKRMIGLTP